MGFEKDWGSFLREVSRTPAKNAEWLRALSYLEYIGYRKMVKALGYEDTQRGVFLHLSDEIRHSFILKDLVEKQFPELTGPLPSRLMELAEDYFQQVDQFADVKVQDCLQVQDPAACYMLVSQAIEKRAMQIYPQYYAELQGSEKYVIQMIIKDERQHLSYLDQKMSVLPKPLAALEIPLGEFEQARFHDFIEQFQIHLSQHLSAA